MNNRQLFLSHLAQTSDAPLMLEIERAEGVYLYGTDQKRYLDLISGISVSNLGHQRPEVKKAIKEQVDKHMHLMVYGEFVQSAQVEFAKALTDQLPDSLDSVYFVNSGSEAVEGALKLARRSTGRSEIINCRNAYHGSTFGALSVMGSEEYKSPFKPLVPGIKEVNFNDLNELVQISSDTAAVIVETIQGEAGVVPPGNTYLKELKNRCQAVGALLILDEIQAGMGRTGTLFAFEQFEVTPDILLTAKALGGGMPLGAFIANKALMNELSHDPALGHITTFGGHPVSCAAGKVALETLLQSNLMNEVKQKETLFRSQLEHQAIKEVRSFGLLMAVEFDSYETNKRIIDRCIELGVITDWFLFADNCLRIAPPLIITTAEIEHACKIILQSINEVA